MEKQTQLPAAHKKPIKTRHMQFANTKVEVGKKCKNNLKRIGEIV